VLLSRVAVTSVQRRRRGGFRRDLGNISQIGTVTPDPTSLETSSLRSGEVSSCEMLGAGVGHLVEPP